MEQNKNYVTLSEIISHFEKQLRAIDDLHQQDVNLMRRTIEEHFERCIHALEVRRKILLEKLDEDIQQYYDIPGQIEKQLKRYINECNEILATGSRFYDKNEDVANRIWLEGLDLPKPTSSVNDVSMKVNLPQNLIDFIDEYGEVSITTDPNQKRFCIVDCVSTVAGGVNGFQDGTGSNARFLIPTDICFNPNDDCFYICDSGNHAIRKLTLQGNVSTFAKGSSFIFWNNFEVPCGITINPKDNCFYVTSNTTSKIFKISIAGEISLLAGSGTEGYRDSHGTDAYFNGPYGIACTPETGNLFVADEMNHAIRVITPQGMVSTFVGGKSGFSEGIGSSALFNRPRGICFDTVDNCLLVCDWMNNKLRRVSQHREVSTVCEIDRPVSVVITANRIILVVTDEHKIFKVTKQVTGYKVTLLAGREEGKANGNAKECRFYQPSGIAIHEESHSCFVADYAIRKINFL